MVLSPIFGLNFQTITIEKKEYDGWALMSSDKRYWRIFYFLSYYTGNLGFRFILVHNGYLGFKSVLVYIGKLGFNKSLAHKRLLGFTLQLIHIFWLGFKAIQVRTNLLYFSIYLTHNGPLGFIWPLVHISPLVFKNSLVRTSNLGLIWDLANAVGTLCSFECFRNLRYFFLKSLKLFDFYYQNIIVS